MTPPEARQEDGGSPAGLATIYVVHADAQLAAVAYSLRDRGYQVVERTPAEALEHLADHFPAALVVDASRPEAIEMIPKVRDSVGSGIEILVLGLPDSPAADPVRTVGTAFFESGVEPAAIVAALDGLLRDRVGVPSLRSTREEDDLPVSSGAPDLLASLIPPIQSMPTSSLPPQVTSSQPPDLLAPLALSSNATAWARGPLAGPTTMSPDLERLLQEAEARLRAEPGSASDVPSPEEEVNAILPADVLAALDEPLDVDQRDVSSNEPPSLQTPTGGGARTTGQHTTGGQAASASVRVETSASLRQEPSTGMRQQTSAGGSEDGRQVTTGSRQLTTGAHELEEGAEEADLTPVPETPVSGPKGSSPPAADAGSEPAQVETRERETSAPPAPPPPPVQDWQTSARAMDSLQITRATEHEDGTPTPPPMMIAELEQQRSQALYGRPPSVPAERRPTIAAPVLPEVLSTTLDGLRAIALCISSRATLSLCFEERSVLRRAVLKDGDFVTCASSATDESLVAYLVARGDLPRDAGVRLGSRLPPFGRHAAAALIAHGYLGQDQLWPVLRAHAEWLLGRMVGTRAGACVVEAEPPGRLKAEPAVFGGAAGAEVLVEVALRVLQPEDALSRLGGSRARLNDGARKSLLSECALPEHAQSWVEQAAGHTVGELLREAGGSEFAPMLVALAELGVLEVLPAVGRDSSEPPERAPDLLDAEAIRARLKARMALVQEGDYFEVLGVPRTATSYEIKRAYLEMRRAYEPSRLLTAATADLAEDARLVIEVIEEAWEALRDPARRERYRAALGALPPA